MKGPNGELAAAITQMEEAVNDMNAAVNLATFKAVDTMEKVLQSMRGQTEFLVSNASIIEKQIAIVVKQNQEIVEVIKCQATSKQQNTLPKPVSTVPFGRDQEFVDRGSIMDEIDRRFHDISSDKRKSYSTSKIALVGLGGVG